MLTESCGYHKMSLFSPYWMINKTGLDIDYLVERGRERGKEGGREREKGERMKVSKKL